VSWLEGAITLSARSAVVPNEKVVISFEWNEPNHPILPGSTVVEITLVPEGEKTRVRLTHHGLPDDAIGDHTNG
jgi:uncharacterized protein YndB with AHSA1/START domain